MNERLQDSMRRGKQNQLWQLNFATVQTLLPPVKTEVSGLSRPYVCRVLCRASALAQIPSHAREVLPSGKCNTDAGKTDLCL